MKRRTVAAALVLAVAVSSTVHAADAPLAPVRAVDDAGRAIVLQRPARRVVTLAPALTELVYAAGGASAMVATILPNDAPAEARALPLVGDALRFDVERVLSLHPDLVLAWHHGNPERALAPLEAAGVTLFRMEPRRLDDVPVALERIGALLGTGPLAHERALALRADIEGVREAHRGVAPVRVFYQVWSEPLMTLNGSHLVSDLISACGGVNVFAALGPLVPQLSTESVLAADPEVFLTARDGFHVASGERRDPDDPAYARWLRFRHLTAVRNRWLYALDGDLVTRPGPRIAQGVRAICAALDEVRALRAAGPR